MIKARCKNRVLFGTGEGGGGNRFWNAIFPSFKCNPDPGKSSSFLFASVLSTINHLTTKLPPLTCIFLAEQLTTKLPPLTYVFLAEQFPLVLRFFPKGLSEKKTAHFNRHELVSGHTKRFCVPCSEILICPLTRMVYLYHISCLRYTILVGNPRKMCTTGVCKAVWGVMKTPYVGTQWRYKCYSIKSFLVFKLGTNL